MTRASIVVSLAVGLLVITLTGGNAWSQASVQSGWWTTAPVAVAPDASEDGLVVQGGPDAAEPVAFAAVSYTLTSGERPEKLELIVTEGSASTPGAALALCPLTTPIFSPARGGAASDAPEYDCATEITASAADDGASYTFDVASLAQEGGLAVAVLPTAATERVVVDAPDASSLQTSAGSATDSRFTSDGSAATDGGFTPDGSSSPSDTGDSSSPAAERSVDPSAATSDGALPPTEVNASPSDTRAPERSAAATSDQADARAQQTFETAAATGEDGSNRNLRGPLFVGLALAAAAMWYLAGCGDRVRAPAVGETGETAPRVNEEGAS